MRQNKRSPPSVPIDDMIKKSYNEKSRAVILYDYLDSTGNNEIKKWLEALRKSNKTAYSKVAAKIKLLETMKNPDIMPGFLEKVPRSTHLLELKTTGRTSHRLILCRGPIDTQGFHNHANDLEYSFLIGCSEKDREYVPPNAVSLAETRRKEIIEDSSGRRKPHENVRP